jgi:hypothetical protein
MYEGTAVPSTNRLTAQVTVTSWLETEPDGAAGAAFEIVFEPIAPLPVLPTDQAASPGLGRASAAAVRTTRQTALTPASLAR